MQRIEPATRLINRFTDISAGNCSLNSSTFSKGYAIEQWHRTRIKPDIDQFERASSYRGKSDNQKSPHPHTAMQFSPSVMAD